MLWWQNIKLSQQIIRLKKESWLVQENGQLDLFKTLDDVPVIHSLYYCENKH